MNVVLMKTKVDHLNAWWEPYATSTPLKKIPAKLENKSKAQDRVLLLKDSVNVTEKLQNARNAFGILQEQAAEKTKCVGSKRNRKGRLSTYFDPSSSSEDDSGEIKKRPIIKLGTKETNTKTLLKNEEPNIEGISTFNLSRSRNLKKNPIIKNNRKTKKNISETDNEKNQNEQALNKKNKSQTEADIFTNSDEENKIFSNSKRNTSLLKGNESLEKKSNSINYFRSDKNFRHPSEFNEIEVQKLKKTPKTNLKLLKSKQTKRNCTINSQVSRNYQKIITNNNSNKLSKFPKANAKNDWASSESLKNKTANSAAKKGTTSTLRQMLITASPPICLENMLNLSHQLFSESREQECINILDLKSDEEDEIHAENKGQEKKLNTQNQTLEKNFIPKDQSLESGITSADKKSEFEHVLAKNDSQIPINKLCANAEKTLKEKNSKQDYKKSCILKNQKKNENETKQKPAAVSEHKTAADNPRSNNFKNQLVNNDTVDCSSSSSEKNTNSIQRNEVHVKDALKYDREKALENSVFKQLDGLSFNKNGSGCSAVQCWSFNNVKCGVFKLKIKAQVKCQTLHCDSHLGGVLVKGQLRMKIGVKEQDLSEGDMVFVPPLTEWRATNIGECESVFYYWCGRFGS